MLAASCKSTKHAEASYLKLLDSSLRQYNTAAVQAQHDIICRVKDIDLQYMKVVDKACVPERRGQRHVQDWPVPAILPVHAAKQLVGDGLVPQLL